MFVLLLCILIFSSEGLRMLETLETKKDIVQPKAPIQMTPGPLQQVVSKFWTIQTKVKIKTLRMLPRGFLQKIFEVFAFRGFPTFRQQPQHNSAFRPFGSLFQESRQRNRLESGPLWTCRVHRRQLHRGYPIVLPCPKAILCPLYYFYTSTFLSLF